uniref:Uncharacterized protein n=1 Tax=Rhizophora mucronata TaxID=61149 RepID=A0A2P2Q472_RHIMU
MFLANFCYCGCYSVKSFMLILSYMIHAFALKSDL